MVHPNMHLAYKLAFGYQTMPKCLGKGGYHGLKTQINNFKEVEADLLI